LTNVLDPTPVTYNATPALPGLVRSERMPGDAPEAVEIWFAG
jgi:hypothetical protein